MKQRLALCAAGCLLLLANTFLAAPAATTQQGEPFKPGCTLPFDAIKEEHPIDENCGPEGDATHDAHGIQNAAKNNFCGAGKSIVVTISTFVKLQKKAEDEEIPFGSSNKLPPDRSVLHDLLSTPQGKLGEGSVVSLVAVVIDARHSNLSKGESVNCKKGGKETNDIHIELGKSTSDDPCTSVTAEISPHFRPSSWDEFDSYDFKGRPVKMTGQIFFDASHSPCRPGKRASPARIAIWEIHPVYAIDVCNKKTLTACKASDKSVWVPFDQWLSSDEEETSDSH
jgi:hypothetical protein